MKFSTEQWLAWLGATVVAAMTMAAYAFSTFETKDFSELRSVSLERRLDRIEGKVDMLVERRSR